MKKREPILVKLQLALGRIFARFHLWTAAVLTLSGIYPVSRLPEATRLRFSYACILARESGAARNAFARLLRRSLGGSAQDDLWLAYTAWCFGALRLSELINRRTQARAAEDPEAAIAGREADFAAAVRSGRLRQIIADEIDEIASDAPGPVIVVPLSSRYMELFGLWKRQVELHAGGGTLVVLALDAAAIQTLEQEGVLHLDLSAYFGFDANLHVDDYSKRHLWVLRVAVLRELIARGHTVLSLDLDAVLVGDLASLLASLPATDIVAQKDYSIPVDSARKLGFTVCCGFVLIRPGPIMDGFLERYAQATVCELDDQTALNHLLVEGGVTEQATTASYLSFRALGLSWVLPDPSLVSRDIGFGTVVRHFQQNIPLAIEEVSRRLGLS